MTRYAMTTKNLVVTYRYFEEDWGFETNLLCEVGEPYQPWFKAEIARRGWEIETRELDAKPWVADFRISKRAG